jgi:hypothetical protein
MGRKPRVERTPEEKWQIVQEGIKGEGGEYVGGTPPPRPKPRRTIASGSWNERWGGSRWRSKS